MTSITKYFENPWKVFSFLAHRGFFKSMDDEQYLKYLFRATVGYELDLENPRTFNEKIQWLKLYDRNQLYTTLVDKCKVKNWVADRIGLEHIVPTYAIWDSVDDIDLSLLPERFVLKTNHDSGGVAVCNDRSKFDFDAAKQKLATSLKRNYYYYGREWPYKDVKPVVFAEKYIEDVSVGELPDYKFFCFDGEAKLMFIATDRLSSEETKFDFFDMEFNHIPVLNGHPNAESIIEKPQLFDEMRILAQRLARDIPHVRVDFYEVGSRVYFGEMTFSHFSGFVPFNPYKYDELFGEWIKLPKVQLDN